MCISLVLIEIGLCFTTEPKYFSRDWLLNYWTIDKDLIFISEDLKAKVQKNFSSSTNKPLIVTLGDSFTEGDPVSVEKNFPSVLKDKLKQENHVDVEMVNLGLGGYGNDQELFLFQRFLEVGNKPDIVIWSFFANDIYENQSQAVYDLTDTNTLQKIDNRKNWIYIRQFVYNLIPLPHSIKSQSRIVNVFLSSFERLEWSPVPKKYDSWEKRRDWGVAKMKVEVEEMKRLAQLHNFEVFFVLIAPQRVYINAEDTNGVYLDWALMEVKTQYEVLHTQPNFVYLKFDELTSSNSAVLGTSTDFAHEFFDDGSRDPLPYGNRHFNEKGYEVFADVVKQVVTPKLSL